jgi:hypothetical protein
MQITIPRMLKWPLHPAKAVRRGKADIVRDRAKSPKMRPTADLVPYPATNPFCPAGGSAPSAAVAGENFRAETENGEVP